MGHKFVALTERLLFNRDANVGHYITSDLSEWPLYRSFTVQCEGKRIHPRQTIKTHWAASDMIQTHNHCISRPVLYQLSYWGSLAGWVTNPRRDNSTSQINRRVKSILYLLLQSFQLALGLPGGERAIQWGQFCSRWWRRCEYWPEILVIRDLGALVQMSWLKYSVLYR